MIRAARGRARTSNPSQADAQREAPSLAPETPGNVRFTSSGPIPPVADFGDAARGPSASELVFGRPGEPLSGASRQADGVQRTKYAADSARTSAAEIMNGLVPAYIAARDGRDASAVGELGGALIGALSRFHGAQLALHELLARVPRQSVAGGTIEGDLDQASIQREAATEVHAFSAMSPLLDSLVASTLTPHRFNGHEVAGAAVVVDLANFPASQRANRLAGELDRTIRMLVLYADLKAKILESKKGLDRQNLDAARAAIGPWASRPLDLAFLRAVLGPIWNVLDATATGPMDAKPTDLLATASKQAQHTGWLGDVGKLDIDEACNELRMGGRQSSEFVIRELYTADPDTRARLLMQIKERGLLDALCSAVGWRDIKDLHDSLGPGFGEIKHALQAYFIGSGKYGPSLGSEWENHDSSLHSAVARLGGAGRVINFALDIGTFGFNSSYGKALDDRSEGLTSEAEASRAKVNTVNRTAAIAMVSMVTGGLAEKFVRGGAGAVSTARAMGAGAAGGSVGAVGALGASDAYNVYVSHEQEQFSSPEEYAKAAILGGVIGGGLGGLTNRLSRGSAKYLPEGTSNSLPGGGEKLLPAGEEPAVNADETARETTRTQQDSESSAPKVGRTRELGLRPQALEALETFENIKRDPIGDVNREPNHNHYKAARREAAGEVVARKPDGSPFDHIRDLQEHYQALERVRRVLEREMQSPMPEISERGIEVLLNKYSELQSTMSRLKGFLETIDQGPPFPPFHEWPPGS